MNAPGGWPFSTPGPRIWRAGVPSPGWTAWLKAGAALELYMLHLLHVHHVFFQIAGKRHRFRQTCTGCLKLYSIHAVHIICIIWYYPCKKIPKIRAQTVYGHSQLNYQAPGADGPGPQLDIRCVSDLHCASSCTMVRPWNLSVSRKIHAQEVSCFSDVSESHDCSNSWIESIHAHTNTVARVMPESRWKQALRTEVSQVLTLHSSPWSFACSCPRHAGPFRGWKCLCRQAKQRLLCSDDMAWISMEHGQAFLVFLPLPLLLPLQQLRCRAWNRQLLGAVDKAADVFWERTHVYNYKWVGTKHIRPS